MVDSPAIDIADLEFSWPSGPKILDLSPFRMEAAERILLRGPSGSGKSTLLSLICGINKPVRGTVHVFGQNLASLTEAARDEFRAAHLGVIFQTFNLLPYLSVLENVMLPCSFSRSRAAAAVGAHGDPTRAAEHLLARLGISRSLLSQSAFALSVGQQQRVAVARALIGKPDLIIADEPTSALDTDLRDEFIELVIEEVAASGAGLLFVSHDMSLGKHFDRVVDLGSINRADLAAETEAA